MTAPSMVKSRCPKAKLLVGHNAPLGLHLVPVQDHVFFRDHAVAAPGAQVDGHRQQIVVLSDVRRVSDL